MSMPTRKYMGYDFQVGEDTDGVVLQIRGVDLRATPPTVELVELRLPRRFVGRFVEPVPLDDDAKLIQGRRITEEAST